MADQALAQLAASARAAKSSITLVRLIDELFQVSDSLALTTQRNDRGVLERHIISALGSKRIEKITGRDLDGLYRQMAYTGFSAASIRHAHTLISRVFSQTVQWGWADKNKAKMATPRALGETSQLLPAL